MSDPIRKARKAAVRAIEEESLWDRLRGESSPLANNFAGDMKKLDAVGGSKFRVPASTKTIVIANREGGVGKTITTISIAAVLAQGGPNVLVTDNDSQGNASTALSARRDGNVATLHDVLVGNVIIRDVMQPTEKLENLFVAPSPINLSPVDAELADQDDRMTRLRDTLRRGSAVATTEGTPLDYVLIDCLPSMSFLPINVLITAKGVLIPVQMEYYALEDLTQLLHTIEGVSAPHNPEFRVSTILLTMSSKNANLSAEVAENARSCFPEQTPETEIPWSVRIAESPSYGETVIIFAPRSDGAIAYLAAAHELASRAE